MSRRCRRREETAESLDLLLDTICNMFGLFIFVAMLVALIASVRAQEPTVEDPRRIEDARLAAARRQRDEVAARLAALDPGALDEESRAAARFGQAVEDADLELAARRARLAALQAALDEQDLLERGAESERPLLEVEVSRLEDELRSIRATREVSVRTPRRRELADRVPAQLVVARGRAYLLNDWSDPAAHPCDSWSTWNPQAVDPDRSISIIHYCWRAGGQHLERTAYLLPEGGVPVTDAARLERDREWRRAIATLDPARHVVSIKVSPDSFREFAAVRAAVAARGFLYDVAPTAIEPASFSYRDEILEGATTAQ